MWVTAMLCMYENKTLPLEDPSRFKVGRASLAWWAVAAGWVVSGVVAMWVTAVLCMYEKQGAAAGRPLPLQGGADWLYWWVRVSVGET